VNQRSPGQEARRQSRHASCGLGPKPAVSIRAPYLTPQPGLKPLPGNWPPPPPRNLALSPRGCRPVTLLANGLAPSGHPSGD